MHAAVNNFVSSKVALAIGHAVFVEPSEISEATRLGDDLELGRFGRLKLAIYLEEAFDLELPDEVLERFKTVADIVDYVSRRYFRNIEPPIRVAEA